MAVQEANFYSLIGSLWIHSRDRDPLWILSRV